MRVPRIAMDRSEIQAVVASFYARIRVHPELGPVFASHIDDWPDHEAKITRFWASAILQERSYDGNPMMVHLAAGNVQSTHFPAWLGLFEEVLKAELPEDKSAQWSALAHRIGVGLSHGLAHYERPAGAVPKF